MKRILTLIYGISCYAVFIATFLYAIGFVGNLIVPKSIDSVPTVSLGTALFINTLLLAVFVAQHSLMARPSFKRAWMEVVPEAAERSTYVLFSSLALILTFALWQPMGTVIWDVDNSLARLALHTSFVFGWLLLFASTFSISHCDLFGLRQTWCYARGVDYAPPVVKKPIFARFVLHRSYAGWIIAFWSTATMTIAHLLFAVVTTLYILIAIQLEEHYPELRGSIRRLSPL